MLALTAKYSNRDITLCDVELDWKLSDLGVTSLCFMVLLVEIEAQLGHLPGDPDAVARASTLRELRNAVSSS